MIWVTSSVATFTVSLKYSTKASPLTLRSNLISWGGVVSVIRSFAWKALVVGTWRTRIPKVLVSREET